MEHFKEDELFPLNFDRSYKMTKKQKNRSGQ